MYKMEIIEYIALTLNEFQNEFDINDFKLIQSNILPNSSYPI